MASFKGVAKSIATIGGSIVGHFAIPPAVAVFARKAVNAGMNAMWGAPKNIFARLGRKAVVEHAGHQAFNAAGVFSGPLGGLAGAATVEGIALALSYAQHRYNNYAYQRDIREITQQNPETGIAAFFLYKEGGKLGFGVQGDVFDIATMSSHSKLDLTFADEDGLESLYSSTLSCNGG